MPATLQDDMGVLWGQLAADAAAEYAFDWPAEAGAIVTSDWASAPPLTLDRQSFGSSQTAARVSGGTAGKWHLVRNTVGFADGSRQARSFRLFILPPLEMLTDPVPSAWGDPFQAVSNLRRDKLLLAIRTYLPEIDLSDTALWRKMRAVEAEVERDLKVWIAPREVVPLAMPAAEIAALRDTGVRVETDPGYDYDGSLYAGQGYGLIDLRHPHVGAVHKVRFTWPGQNDTLYDVPADWIRLEPKPGRIQLVPTPHSAGIPLPAFAYTIFAGGRTLPLSVQVAYRAGLENVAADYPDLLDLMGRRVALSLLDGAMLPATITVTADGLTQTFPWDRGKFAEEMEGRTKTLRQALRGPQIGVF